MPQNFLDGCKAVEAICEGYPRVNPELVDFMLVTSGLTAKSSLETVSFVPLNDGELDTRTLLRAVDAADKCAVCTQASQCMLGQFFRQLR